MGKRERDTTGTQKCGKRSNNIMFCVLHIRGTNNLDYDAKNLGRLDFQGKYENGVKRSLVNI